MDVCGVYVIECSANGQCYIGSSVSVSKRWYAHRLVLARGKHHSPYLQNAWNKHGPEAFRMRVLEACPNEERLAREQAYIDAFKPAFNVCPLARSRYGSKATPETRAKISAAQTGKRHPRTATHCPNGHPYSGDNLLFDANGWRVCRACRAAAQRARHPEPANKDKTHCPKGHPLEGDNLIVRARGGRLCRICDRASKHASAERKRREAGAKRYGPNKTHCLNGHPVNEENTRVDPKTGWRLCRVCEREKARAYQRRKRAAAPLAVSAGGARRC